MNKPKVHLGFGDETACGRAYFQAPAGGNADADGKPIAITGVIAKATCGNCARIWA